MFDFSGFHPLDHWAFTSRCRSAPGGPLRHIAFWQAYQLDFIGPWRRRFFCPRGQHRPRAYWLGGIQEDGGAHAIIPDFEDEPSGFECADCWEALDG